MNLQGVDLEDLPYPIALTATRLCVALEQQTDIVKTLFQLKDCFEAAIKFAGAAILTEYLHSSASNQDRNQALLQKIIRPSLGTWVSTVVGDASRWLLGNAAAPQCAWARLFFQPGQGQATRPKPQALFERCEQFVAYRNDALGHGAVRSDAVYRRDLEQWLPPLVQLLRGIASLSDTRLALVVDEDRCQMWMGPQPTSATQPGKFRRDQIGHFILCYRQGSREVLPQDLYPFICYVPDADQTQRLHFYDSIYRYQESRKEVSLLEYDNGFRHATAQPVPALEEAFTRELLAKVFQRHQGLMEVIEGRVANFGELLVEHVHIVGRRFVIEQVRNFLDNHDRGLLVIEGEPGKGKTALLAHLIEEEFGHYAPPPVHFFYRRTAGITNPDVCVKSIYHALLEAHDMTEAEESKRQNSPDEVYNKLVNLLAQSLGPRLSPRRPQLIFLDALDESEATLAGRTAFDRIPENLPENVFVIATTRPVQSRTILARRAHLHWYDLDAPDLEQENLRDGADYVRIRLADSNLPETTLEQLAKVGKGNFLVLKLLCEHVGSRLPPTLVHPFLTRLSTADDEDKLGFIYQEFWERLAGRLSRQDTNLICDVAGLLVTARAPLTAEMICACLKLRAGDWDFALRQLVEYLTAIEEAQEDQHETYYRIYHESFADFLRAKVAPDQRHFETLLTDFCLGWRNLLSGRGRLYALTFAAAHAIATDRWNELEALLTDLSFLEAKVSAGLVFNLANDFAAAGSALPKDRLQSEIVRLFDKALRRDIQFIERHRDDYPQALFQCLWNACWWYQMADSDVPHPRHSLTPAQRTYLRGLLESWRAAYDTAHSAPWIRSLTPPSLSLDLECVSLNAQHYVRCLSTDRKRHLASLTSNGKVHIWNYHTLQLERELTLECHGDQPAHLCYSEDGRYLFLASHITDVLIVLDAATYETLTTIRTYGALCLAVAPDGEEVVLGCESGFRIWKWRDSADTRSFLVARWQLEGSEYVEPRSNPCVAARFRPSGSQLVCLGGKVGVELVVWDKSPRLFGRGMAPQTISEYVERCVISPDGNVVLCACLDKTLLYDIASTRTLQLGDLRNAPAAAFSDDGFLIAVGDKRGSLHIWNTTTALLQARFRAHDDALTSIVWLAGDRIATASQGGSIRIWNTAQLPNEPDSASDYRVANASFSSKGDLLAIADSLGVSFREGPSGTALSSRIAHRCSACDVTFSDDDAQLAVTYSDNTIAVYDTKTFEECARRKTNSIHSFGGFSRCGTLLVSLDILGHWQVWNLRDGSVFARHKPNAMYGLWFVGDTELFCINGDRKTACFDLKTGMTRSVSDHEREEVGRSPFHWHETYGEIIVRHAGQTNVIARINFDGRIYSAQDRYIAGSEMNRLAQFVLEGPGGK